MSRRRGVTILFVVGALAIMSIVVFGLMAQTSQRYAQSRRFEDSIQALHLAQAGLLWAQGGDSQAHSPGAHRLDLSPVGAAQVTIRAEGANRRIEAEGQVVRDGEVVASRRLTLDLPAEGNR